VDPDDSKHPAANPQTQEYTGTASEVSGLFTDEDFGGDFLSLPNPGYLGFLHAGVPWGTVSLTFSSNPSDVGATDLVYLRNFADYLIGPVSPYENALDVDGDGTFEWGDDDGDGFIDERPLVDEGDESDNADGINNDGDYEDANGVYVSADEDRFGPEIRTQGRVNVNTASRDVLRAVLKDSWLQAMGVQPATIADAIIAERSTPFSSVDDFFDRVPELYAIDPNGDGATTDHPNSFRREALARFMHNLVTVRTDVWGCIVRVRLYEDGNGNGVRDADEGIIVEKLMHYVFDRSYPRVKTILRREQNF
jgi:hypothetical protein